LHDLALLTELALAIGAALAGGLIARRLRLPPLVGYLLAGVVVGPNTPGVFANAEAVQSVAQLGVAFLMFTVGVQFSLEELHRVRRVALLGGGIQIAATIVLGTLLGLALGWGAYGGLFLGCAISLSSTAVMSRVLEERGELGSSHGTVMLAILVVQDLTLVFLALLLPALATVASDGPGALAGIGLSLLRALLSVGLALFLATRAVPKLLDRVSRTGSQELFLLTVVTICLVAAHLAHLAGLSLEIGAFLAGLVITESEYAQEVFSQIRPLRDVFASLFFVSVGMLLNPAFVAGHWLAILLVVIAIIAGKGLIATVAIFSLGQHGRTALQAGLGLAQIGEFSFVLAAMGAQKKLIPHEVSAVILSAALITLLLAPAVSASAVPIYTRLSALPALGRRLQRQEEPGATHAEADEEPRVLVLGGGRVGGMVSQALRAKGILHRVVEYDAGRRASLHAEGVPVVYGDALSDVVLRSALGPEVELAVVALPETSMTEMAVRKLKQLAPELRVVARVHRHADAHRAHAAGADDVTYAEQEVAAAIIRHGFERLGLPEPEIADYVRSLRART